MAPTALLLRDAITEDVAATIIQLTLNLHLKRKKTFTRRTVPLNPAIVISDVTHCMEQQIGHDATQESRAFTFYAVTPGQCKSEAEILGRHAISNILSIVLSAGMGQVSAASPEIGSTGATPIDFGGMASSARGIAGRVAGEKASAPSEKANANFLALQSHLVRRIKDPVERKRAVETDMVHINRVFHCGGAARLTIGPGGTGHEIKMDLRGWTGPDAHKWVDTFAGRDPSTKSNFDGIADMGGDLQFRSAYDVGTGAIKSI